MGITKYTTITTYCQDQLLYDHFCSKGVPPISFTTKGRGVSPHGGGGVGVPRAVDGVGAGPRQEFFGTGALRNDEGDGWLANISSPIFSAIAFLLYNRFAIAVVLYTFSLPAPHVDNGQEIQKKFRLKNFGIRKVRDSNPPSPSGPTV